MPIERDRYPAQWEAIALSVKWAANWRCQKCDRPCRKTGESLFDFIERIKGIPHTDLDWINQTAVSTICQHPTRFVLTCAHIDQDPENPNAELRAWCAPCHLKHDRPFRQRKCSDAVRMYEIQRLAAMREEAIATIKTLEAK